MIQIGVLVIAVGLLIGGVLALMGKEKAGKETPKSVAIAMIVAAVALALFGLVGLPMMLKGAGF